MEMKYLVEQDTGVLFFPAVHVEGIKGLSLNVDKTVKSGTIDLSKDTNIAAGSTLKYSIYNQLVYLSAEVIFTQAGITRIQNGDTIDISITDANFPKLILTEFDTICYDSFGPSSKCYASIEVDNKTLSILVSVKTNSYDDDGKITEVNNEITKLYGTASTIYGQ